MRYIFDTLWQAARAARSAFHAPSALAGDGTGDDDPPMRNHPSSRIALGASLLVVGVPAQEQPPVPGQVKTEPLPVIELKQSKKILLISGRKSHGYGSHEFTAGNLLMAKLLQSRFKGLTTKVFQKGAWPEPGDFVGVDSVVLFCNGGGGHLVNKRLDEFDKLMKQGVGAAFLHYGVETVPGRPSEKFIEWIGGHFQRFWSVNPHWVAEFKILPKHAITRGVKPFQANDEWYFHMRFRPKMAGVTPILSAVPPASTMKRKDGPHSGNPDVRKAVKNKIPQHVAWAFDRADGGRGFGFTGLHRHWNFKDDDFRKLVLNAIAWTAKIDIPEDGIATKTPTEAELEANQDYPKRVNRPGRKKRAAKKKGEKKAVNGA